MPQQTPNECWLRKKNGLLLNNILRLGKLGQHALEPRKSIYLQKCLQSLARAGLSQLYIEAQHLEVDKPRYEPRLLHCYLNAMCQQWQGMQSMCTAMPTARTHWFKSWSCLLANLSCPPRDSEATLSRRHMVPSCEWLVMVTRQYAYSSVTRAILARSTQLNESREQGSFPPRIAGGIRYANQYCAPGSAIVRLWNGKKTKFDCLS